VTEPVLLFDGVCNFCNSTVQFILQREKEPKLRFAPLQSQVAADLLASVKAKPADLNTVILIEEGRCYHRSTAALRVTRYLRFPWPLLYVFILVPRFLRDMAYDFVARNRYRWFGKSETCQIPTPALRARFLA
jgi:predicted DCC family thiol-disulfide oxidoreductase YuxK